MTLNFLHLIQRPAALACLCFALSPETFAQSPAPSPVSLEVVVLGSGGPGATGRAGSSYLVLLDGVPRILVDAGPGSFARLGEAKMSLSRTDIVLLTHLHIDHVGELPGLFKARAVSGGGPIHFQVFGPDGRRGKGDEATFPSTSRWMQLLFDKQGAFGYLRDFSSPMTIQTTDVRTALQPERDPQVLLSDGRLTIRAIAGHHRDAPAVIYRIDYAGKSVTFSGDIDASGLPGLRKIARGTDLLVFNSVVLDPPQSPAILYTLHTPPKAIGELARDVGAGQLVLSHLSPVIDREHDAVGASIARAYSGQVSYASDGAVLVP